MITASNGRKGLRAATARAHLLEKLPPRFFRRTAVMLLGIVTLGLGIALFKISLMGNDPSSAMAMAIAGALGKEFSIVLIALNTLFFAAEALWGRRLIGVGTFVNWFCVGTASTFFIRLLNGLFTVPDAFWGRLPLLPAGVLVLSFACSLYQTADLGIAPYDSLSIMLARRLPVPYFWCRILTDCCCTLVAFALGGVVGLGTLLCSVGFGPFISFFTKHVAERLCGNR